MTTIANQISTLQQLVDEANISLRELRKRQGEIPKLEVKPRIKGTCEYIYKRKLGNPVCGNSCWGSLCHLHTPEHMLKVSQSANKWNKRQLASEESRLASRAYHREYMRKYKVNGPQYAQKPSEPQITDSPDEK